MTVEFVVDVHDLCKSFNGKIAVNQVSLQIKRGEIFGFLGPNGSGKTTTIRMLCGLMTPDSGSGQCLGYDITKHSSMMKQLVGYVPQTFSLYRDLTVFENLCFIARIYNERDDVEQVQQVMQELKLDAYKHILAGGLSGGWKQRLSLAAALIHQPKLLLLDEPTAGVDPKARREFWNDITRLTQKGMTALVSTHYMDEAERCNRLAYIVSGRMKAKGTIDEIIQFAGLTTWEASGENVGMLVDPLRQERGIEQVVVWGNVLRACGSDPQLVEQAISKFPEYTWQRVNTSLEEVFIHLT